MATVADPTLDALTDADEAWWDDQHDACSADPGYLADNYGVIDKPKRPAVGAVDEPALPDELGGSNEGGTVPFKLWPAQVPIMGLLATERLVMILKARQLGISWLVCAYVLWLVLFNGGQVVFLYSKGQDEANDLLQRIKSLYRRLPDRLRARLPRPQGKDNTREWQLSNGSTVRSMPATAKKGISFTASLVVLDEWAHQAYGGKLYEMVKPIIEAGGQLIILSTANGVGNWFHTLWARSVKGLNSFRTVFLPWWARPGRDWAWYTKVVADSNDPDAVKENYPANAVEAFRATGRVRFPADWIEAQAKNTRESLPPHQWPKALRECPDLDRRRLRVYKPALEGHRYLVMADVAEGKETSNYDAAVVIDEETWEEVACLHGQWEPDVFAGFLIALGTAYNTATVIPERNNHGHAVLTTLKLKKYPRIGLGHDGYPGWLTNPSTKPSMIDFVAEVLRRELITIRSAATLGELSTYKRLKDGTTGAESGDYDDLVMAWAVGLAYLRERQKTPPPAAPQVDGVSSRPPGFLAVPAGLGFPGVNR